MRKPRYPLELVTLEFLNRADPDFFELYDDLDTISLGIAEEVANLGVIEPEEITELKTCLLCEPKVLIQIREKILKREKIESDEVKLLLSHVNIQSSP